MSQGRIGIIGSCVTRDLWPLADQAPKHLSYVARTSLPSLLSPRPPGLHPAEEPPPPLKRQQHNALRADIEKTALATLVAFRPTHLIFDFIDERFDLLQAEGGLVTRSWELETSGYMAASTATFTRIPRLSSGCDRLWNDAVREMAAVIALSPLNTCQIILHASRWAHTYRDAQGALQAFPPEVEILPRETANIREQNDLLARYEARFLAAFPAAAIVRSDLGQADEAHRWGLSPFHYVDAYYEDIRGQLARLGAV